MAYVTCVTSSFTCVVSASDMHDAKLSQKTDQELVIRFETKVLLSGCAALGCGLAFTRGRVERGVVLVS